MSHPDIPEYLRSTGAQQMLRLGLACAASNEKVSFEVATDERQGIAISAFFLAHEQHSSILNLLMEGRLGSALALLRPAFETLLCGLWLLRGASSEALDLFIEGRHTPTPERMLRGLKKGGDPTEDAFLEDTWNQSKSSLNQYTHCSFQLLARRLPQEVLEEPMTPEETTEVIRFATSTAMLATVELARIAGDAAQRDRALSVLSRLHPVVDA